MKFTSTDIQGLLILEPVVFKDDRGYFFECYNEKKFTEGGILNTLWVQDNESKSSKGVLRGMHYQLEPYAQAKLVRVISGSVFDVAVDIRKGSPTFGKWYGVELSCENKKQFYIPRGFAHGFSVLSDSATFIYKCDNFYTPSAEKGFNPFDFSLKISWGIEKSQALLSPRDASLPSMNDAEMNFSL
ncbi:MAG: dTDP-4-dehydrorhamnose 3,5-epimerase [Bacteroidetes bacterium RIFOXYA12_FULL_35_11]|nr:MAG: dTDP-4-dehydrorhamnose 3,5-epimerase [Bacteroidetes bacterium GWF2_35_48]OFY75098.1 MAG: dTDP-4-dehydrorhamnose 3,5-epimerase [Bacteroidetes bacterium RIFOXYA12_FULL_35_11]OFY95767.1 MAG: dTDP-4-dehydrorhamnose 3,5-epimerase [Bacteroidetes bacterium RIFOXYB2_FULL_35_7]OFZ02050.1 MAG: dTDP-4-dehydrorhamnose 3,5-epimerase [Bacteroidetes bacterium RIFOXYC12_FULL_35_7]HBX52125.1 dTDP-4-dehydrorhamnose 3,5-epimerase [Bacteroidales bacterium]